MNHLLIITLAGLAVGVSGLVILAAWEAPYRASARPVVFAERGL